MSDRRRRLELRGPLELTVQLVPETAGETETAVPGWVTPLPAEAGGAIQRFEVVVEGWRFEVRVEDAAQAELRETAAQAAREHSPAAAASLNAQIAGRVTRVWVTAGQEVEAGERLLTVEAMKMENELRSPVAGRVAAVHVTPGQTVERNDPLVSLA